MASSPAFDIPLVVSGVSPSEGLTNLGGDLLTISGSGFPTRTAPEVALDDGTSCIVQSFNTAEIKCVTGRFDQFALKSDYELTVTVNGLSETLTVFLEQTEQRAVSISP